MDGVFSDNVPLKSQGSLTVSSFYGDFDICPKSSGGIVFPVPILHQWVELTRNNYQKVFKILFPSPSADLNIHYYEGYTDAQDFLSDRSL